VFACAFSLAFDGFIITSKFTSHSTSACNSPVLRTNVHIEPHSASNHILFSKTDKYKKETTIHLLRINTIFCPVPNLESYLVSGPKVTV